MQAYKIASILTSPLSAPLGTENTLHEQMCEDAVNSSPVIYCLGSSALNSEFPSSTD